MSVHIVKLLLITFVIEDMNNMRYNFFVFLFLTITTFSTLGQESEMYRLILKNKGNTSFSIERPQEFLSQKSIDRRINQGFSIDESDLPIDPLYFDKLVEVGAQIITSSKWAKTIVVNLYNPDLKSEIEQLPFVDSLTKVWEGDLSLWRNEDLIDEPVSNLETASSVSRIVFDSPLYEEDIYGASLTQLRLNNVQPLHELGYTGKGKTIAVIDGGFENVDQLTDYFDQNQILGVKNFSHNLGNPYRLKEIHGTTVLSCLLSYNPGVLIGTAPEASYYLFNTEVAKEEYPVEEDYWMAAVEYADSLGVDIITTSLGYSTFDDSSMDHSWDDLDGYTIPASRVASMIAKKGMVLFVSCGNQGSVDWTKTTVPGDGKDILTVGAVNKDSVRAPFSSWGSIVDGRIKPDIMAMGSKVSVVNHSGEIIPTSGTSFSTPLMAGMGACLWQALPDLNSLELINLIKASSDRSYKPDEEYGWGLPDIYRAYKMDRNTVNLPLIIQEKSTVPFYINHINNMLHITPVAQESLFTLKIYTLEGLLINAQKLYSPLCDLSFLRKGIYIVSVETNAGIYIQRYIKQ